MQKFELTPLFDITGIGAASGIVYTDGFLYIVSDNSRCLYRYHIDTRKLDKFAVLPDGICENVAKKEKPDFEALAHHDNKLYLFGSGSTDRRNKLIIFDLSGGDYSFSEFDLSKLYLKMRYAAGISENDFNIEGATCDGKTWYLFQRGNGLSGSNGIFTITGNILQNDVSITYKEIRLPEISAIPATFTDAVYTNGKIWFLAAAENSNSVYEDGEILGSIIGCIGPVTFEIIFTSQISDRHKFEGLTCHPEVAGDKITFLLCEDNDTESAESTIYKLSLPQ